MRRVILGSAVVAAAMVGSGTAWSLTSDDKGSSAEPTCNGKPAVEVDPAVDGWQGTSGADVVVLTTDGDGVRYDGRGGDDSICIAEGLRGVNLTGGSGDDYIAAPVTVQPRGDNEAAFVFGGAGDDELVGSDFVDVIYGGPGGDSVSGLAGDDYLLGDGIPAEGAYNSPFVDGADIVDGGAGDDRIGSSVAGDNGVSRADVLAGGTGVDLLEFGDSRVGLVLDLVAATAVVRSDGAESGNADTFSGFESYEGGGDGDLLVGGPEADHLDGGFGRDRVIGGDGSDRLRVAEGVIVAGPGDDVFNEVANGPRVRARMGLGNDRVTLLSGRHSVVAGPGDDSILVHSLEGRYDVAGGSGTDTLITKQCAHSDTGTVVTCGRSTTTYTSIEVHRHRTR